MLASYLDDSGTDKGSTNITMAGYVSHVDRWIDFEQRSGELFRRERLKKPFHAKEFYSTDDEYSGWDWSRKTGFVFDWFNIAHETVQKGITISIPKAKYQQAKNLTRLAARQSSYGHCFACVVDQLIKDWDLGPAIQRDGITFFVEAGNNNNAELLTWFNEMRKNPDLTSILKSLTFIEKRECRAIQLADFLAFFSRRLANNHSDRGLLEMHELLGIAKEKVNTLGFLAEEFMPRTKTA